MHLKFIIPVFALFLYISAVRTQAEPPDIKTTDISGVVQIQREGTKKWAEYSFASVPRDNDIIKTSFKASVQIRIAGTSVLTLGANSKVLINYSDGLRQNKWDFTVTVFEGALYSDIGENLNYTLYSATSVTKGENLQISMIVDGSTGESVFHAFEGRAVLKNITLRQQKWVAASEKSIIEANSPPTDPVSINNKDINIMSKFYGSDFISKKVAENAIDPEVTSTLETAQAKSTELSGKLRLEDFMFDGKYKPLFDYSTIIKKIRAYEREKFKMINTPEYGDYFGPFSRILETRILSTNNNGVSYLDVIVSPGIKWKNFSLSLNLPFKTSGAGQTGLWMYGLPGVLDKINFFRADLGRNYFYIGGIESLTTGSGLVMNGYSNQSRSSVYHTKGLEIQFIKGNLLFRQIIGDISDMAPLVTSIGVDLLTLYLEVSHYLDGDLNEGYDDGDFGYRNSLETYASPSLAGRSEDKLQIYEISANALLADRRPVRVNAYFGFAQMLDKDMQNRGYSMIIPGIEAVIYKAGLNLELFMEDQNFVYGIFDKYYEEMKVTIDPDGRRTTLIDSMKDNTAAKGIKIGARYNIFKDCIISGQYRSNLFKLTGGGRAGTVSPNADNDYNREDAHSDSYVEFKIKCGRETAFFLEKGEIYFNSGHLDYYYDIYSFSDPNPFKSMGADFEFTLTNRYSAVFGWENYYIDKDGSRSIEEPGEVFTTIKLGAKAGF